MRERDVVVERPPVHRLPVRPGVVWTTPVRYGSPHFMDQIAGAAGLASGEERLDGEA